MKVPGHLPLRVGVSKTAPAKGRQSEEEVQVLGFRSQSPSKLCVGVEGRQDTRDQ